MLKLTCCETAELPKLSFVPELIYPEFNILLMSSKINDLHDIYVLSHCCRSMEFTRVHNVKYMESNVLPSIIMTNMIISHPYLSNLSYYNITYGC